MVKKMEDLTFSEFVSWCNNRACDGSWSLCMATTCIEVIKKLKRLSHYLEERKLKKKSGEKLRENILF